MKLCGILLCGKNVLVYSRVEDSCSVINSSFMETAYVYKTVCSIAPKVLM